MIGLGIVTYNRPDYFRQSVRAAYKYKPDYLVIYNDGSDEKDYQEIYQKYPADLVIHADQNQGVAKAKNTLLRELLAKGCEHLFLLEDDIIIKSGEVFERYIRAGKKSGIQHFNFAHHGPANVDGLQYSDGLIDYYPHCVGAFSYYTRECIEQSGFMDEHFVNCWEHVEHTKRIGDLGYTTPFTAFADVTGSKELLAEIPGSIEYSSIRRSKAWKKRMAEGLKYWKSIDPTCPVEMEGSI
jgi:GT2 family glycosyltransferase